MKKLINEIKIKLLGREVKHVTLLLGDRELFRAVGSYLEFKNEDQEVVEKKTVTRIIIFPFRFIQVMFDDGVVDNYKGFNFYF